MTCPSHRIATAAPKDSPAAQHSPGAQAACCQGEFTTPFAAEITNLVGMLTFVVFTARSCRLETSPEADRVWLACMLRESGGRWP